MKKTMVFLQRIIKKVFAIIKSTGIKFDSLYFFKLDINKTEIVSKKYIVTKAIDIDDLEDVYKERESYFKKVYQKWLSLGYICFIVKLEGKTVGLLWLNNTGIVPLDFNYQLKISDKHEAALIDGYILRNYRGQGIYKDIWNAALYEANNMSITTLHVTILKNNIKSIEIHYTLGLKKVYQVLHLYRILWFNILHFEKFKTSVDISKLRKGINFKH